MVLEFLFQGEEQADKCVAKIDAASVLSSKKALADNCFIVTAYLKSESEASAIILSKLFEEIISSVECTVLSDESSAYYDKNMFPMINTFERKLRKLLYAASVINAVEDNKISDLEKKDFGEIFEMLFRDDDYWNNVKAYVNGQKKGQKLGWQGFARELQIFLESKVEKPLWDKLLPGKVPSLRGNFSDVQRYRNDIMHAHYIKRSEYLEMKKLFKNVNDELDEAIESLADGALIPETYNEDLGHALTYLTDSDGDYITDNFGERIILNV